MFNPKDYPYLVTIRTTYPCPAELSDVFIATSTDMVILNRGNVIFSNDVIVEYGFVREDDAVAFKLRFG